MDTEYEILLGNNTYLAPSINTRVTQIQYTTVVVRYVKHADLS